MCSLVSVAGTKDHIIGIGWMCVFYVMNGMDLVYVFFLMTYSICSITQGGVDHAHAFVLNPEVTRFCSVTQMRGGTDNIIFL